jgi:HD-like signal output (HDOD) protein
MKRILFVDDEAAVLEGIRTLLHRRRDEWQMEFVDSAAAALTLLEKQPYDLICSDVRMSPMDGIQLLTAVAERWPQTVRIVLSGYAQTDQAMRLVHVAHQFLSKPCQPDQFDNVLERCLRVQELLTRQSLRTLVGRVKKLPSLPRIYGKLRQIMSNPNVSTTDIAKIVAEDVAISAKLLQVVNSAFFRLAKRITKIEQAVAYLGFATVRNLVLSVEVFSQWNKSAAKGGVDPECMQAEALLAATVARAFAEGTPMVDDALVAGLVRDIGYLVLGAECPDDLRRARQLAVDQNIPMHHAERKAFGATHAEVGAYLLALWGFPYPIVEAVAHHHEPGAVPHSEFDLLGVLAVATALISEHSKKVSSNGVTPIDEKYLLSIRAPFSLSQAQERVLEIQAAGTGVGA